MDKQYPIPIYYMYFYDISEDIQIHNNSKRVKPRSMDS